MPLVIILAFALTMIDLSYLNPLRCIRQVEVTDGRWGYIEAFCNLNPQNLGPIGTKTGHEPHRTQIDRECKASDDAISEQKETLRVNDDHSGRMGNGHERDPLSGQMDTGSKSACIYFILILLFLCARSITDSASMRLFFLLMSGGCLAFITGRENIMSALNPFTVLELQHLPSVGSCAFVDPDNHQGTEILCVFRANEFIPTAIEITFYILLPLFIMDLKASL